MCIYIYIYVLELRLRGGADLRFKMIVESVTSLNYERSKFEIMFNMFIIMKGIGVCLFEIM